MKHPEGVTMRATSIVAVVITLSSTALAGSEYAQWRGSPARDGLIREAAPVFADPAGLSLTEAWKIPMPGGADGNYSSAVIVGDRIFARVSRNPTPDNPKSRERVEELHCIKLADGSVVWKKDLATVKSGTAQSTPCVAEGMVFMVLSDGTVCAADQESGEVRWQQSIAAPREISMELRKSRKKVSYNSSPTLVDGKVIVGSYHLFALDAKTGEVAWRQEQVFSGSGSPAVWRHGDKTYVVAGSPTSLVDLDDGRVAWSIEDGYGDTTPCITGDVLAMAAAGDKAKKTKSAVLMLRLSPERGEEIARIPASATSPATDGQHIFFRSGGTRYCVAAADGKEVWQNRKPQTVGSFVASTILAGGTMITWAAPEHPAKDGSGAGQQIGFYRKADGNELAACDIPDLGYGSFPAVSGDRIVFRGWKNLCCYQVKP